MHQLTGLTKIPAISQPTSGPNALIMLVRTGSGIEAPSGWLNKPKLVNYATDQFDPCPSNQQLFFAPCCLPPGTSGTPS